MSLSWSHDRVTNFNVRYLAFYQLITFTKQVYAVINQLLQEGSVTWDMPHSITIVILGLVDSYDCLTFRFITQTVSNCVTANFSSKEVESNYGNLGFPQVQQQVSGLIHFQKLGSKATVKFQL